MGRTLQVILASLLLLALFFAVNMLSAWGLRGARLDATEGSMFTLTKGSRAIARSADEPVHLTLYYSAKLAQGRPEIQSYAQRVREMLEEFQRGSDGKVILEVIDPEPFSEAEDKAVAAGLVGIPVNNAGESLYLGLVGTNSIDTKETIAFFDPRKERFLEYDISRLVYSLAHPQRRVVGLLSGLPLEGGFTMDPRTRQPQQTPPWQIMSELRGVFEVKSLNDPATIPDDLSVLLVVHPKNLSETALFALDQYVLRGGKAVLFIDPLCENDEGGGMGAPPEQRASNLSRLFDAWGIESPPDVLAADNQLAESVFIGTRQRPEQVSYMVWLGCDKRALARDDAVTGNLGKVNFATSGILRVKKDATEHVTLTPIVTTTRSAMAMPRDALGFPPDPKAVARQYVAGTEALTLAARLGGKARTAFPDGRPKPAQGQPAPPDAGPALAQSTGDIQVIVVADCDVLADNMWARQQNVFGQNVLLKLADNADFLMSAIDNLSGSTDLISVRARRESARPFKTVEAMRKRAEQRYLAEQKLLEEKLKETEANLAALQGKRGEDKTSLVLTPAQEAEVEKFRAEMVDTRKRLRAIKKEQRDDIESLGVQLQLINTALVPALVVLVAAGAGLVRRSRRAASVAAARGAREAKA
jgi:ABC-type uncharacterized transport system involved in gliding motility auxiliary subunit